MSRFIRSLSIWTRRPYGVMTPVGDLRCGDVIDHQGRAMCVHTMTSSQVGRGTRTFVLTLRDVRTQGQTTLKSAAKDRFDRIDLRDATMRLLYREGSDVLHVLDPRTLEQTTLPAELCPSAILPYLESGHDLRVRFQGQDCVAIVPPRILTCTVREVTFVQESQEHSKYTCTLDGGARVVLPLNFAPGDAVLVDTDTQAYAGKP
jgi:translation elongation factor P/translation initiation factor 5A